MVKNTDLITVFKEFPHIDFVDAAKDLVNLVNRTIKGSIRPVISTFDCRFIDVFPTTREPMQSFLKKVKNLEGKGKTLSVSVIHGFMAGDVPDLGAKIIVITDDAQPEGDALARKLGLEFFSMRGKTRPELISPCEAINLTKFVTDRPIVIADVWDNPGGVPGDSTILLQEMIRQKVHNAAMATIWDPVAVRTCISAGENVKLQLRFGGKMSLAGGKPLDAEVTICRIMRNACQNFGDSVVPLGDSVWINVEGIDAILNSVRCQVFNPNVFSNFGIIPNEKSVLVVKSTNHFYASFSEIASKIIYVAIDGLYPSNPNKNVYMNLSRKIWPLIDNPHVY